MVSRLGVPLLLSTDQPFPRPNPPLQLTNRRDHRQPLPPVVLPWAPLPCRTNNNLAARFPYPVLLLVLLASRTSKHPLMDLLKLLPHGWVEAPASFLDKALVQLWGSLRHCTDQCIACRERLEQLLLHNSSNGCPWVSQASSHLVHQVLLVSLHLVNLWRELRIVLHLHGKLLQGVCIRRPTVVNLKVAPCLLWRVVRSNFMVDSPTYREAWLHRCRPCPSQDHPLEVNQDPPPVSILTRFRVPSQQRAPYRSIHE